MSVKAAQVTTCFYWLMQIDLISSIYLFIYSKLCQEKQVEAITCICLLMEIICWLRVLFVLIFIIYYLFIPRDVNKSKWKRSPVFVYLWKLFVDYVCFSF